MHHAGLVLLLLVALLILGPLMIQGIASAGPMVGQAGQFLESAVALVDFSAAVGVLAIIIAGLLALAILRLTVGF